ncbi:MAG: bifunctional 4-hydroxy-2-oxoglutarate aldolase/2-dehydro-3-deoxy-phosphogluconate aldolase [Pseudomonadota bacterium]
MQIEKLLNQSPIVPVIVIEKMEQAVPLAEALLAGGLNALEVTLRSSIALSAIETIASNVPDANVGVGTITQAEQFKSASDAGAGFAVSPGLTPALGQAASQSGLPFLPGVFSPGDLIQAMELGFNTCKLFPAKQAGGIDMLKALHGPFPEARFCPTGGVNADNFETFLALPNVICVGGSWVCPPKLVAAGAWDEITRLAKNASKTAGNIQS